MPSSSLAGSGYVGKDLSGGNAAAQRVRCGALDIGAEGHERAIYLCDEGDVAKGHSLR